MPKKNAAEILAEGKGNADQVVEKAITNTNSRHAHTRTHTHFLLSSSCNFCWKLILPFSLQAAFCDSIFYSDQTVTGWEESAWPGDPCDCWALRSLSFRES